jgi:hypothetical protein
MNQVTQILSALEKGQSDAAAQLRQSLDALAAPEPDNELLALDEGLRQLALTDPERPGWSNCGTLAKVVTLCEASESGGLL